MELTASASAPPKATPAKEECPTRKGAIPSADLPLPLAQMFSTEGKVNHHVVTVVILDATAMHVVSQGGKGLKQLHDISGARVDAYTVTAGPCDECHISLRGTDTQIGDALVVLGMSIPLQQRRLGLLRLHPNLPPSHSPSPKN